MEQLSQYGVSMQNLLSSFSLAKLHCLEKYLKEKANSLKIDQTTFKSHKIVTVARNNIMNLFSKYLLKRVVRLA